MDSKLSQWNVTNKKNKVLNWKIYISKQIFFYLNQPLKLVFYFSHFDVQLTSEIFIAANKFIFFFYVLLYFCDNKFCVLLLSTEVCQLWACEWVNWFWDYKKYYRSVTTKFFNPSLHLGELPKELPMANVKCLFKAGDKKKTLLVVVRSLFL